VVTVQASKYSKGTLLGFTLESWPPDKVHEATPVQFLMHKKGHSLRYLALDFEDTATNWWVQGLNFMGT
jgi:hypothetical protein